jgi:hypothetical protein
MTSFSKTKVVFEITESKATLDFRLALSTPRVPPIAQKALWDIRPTGLEPAASNKGPAAPLKPGPPVLDD